MEVCAAIFESTRDRKKTATSITNKSGGLNGRPALSAAVPHKLATKFWGFSGIDIFRRFMEVEIRDEPHCGLRLVVF